MEGKPELERENSMDGQSLVQPEDVYNFRLVSNVRPLNWKNPDPASRYNLVVIGAGTAGLVAAAAAAGLGAKVALIERHLLGGDCLNVGCVPSKAIIRSSRVIADLRGADRYGLQVGRIGEADFTAVMERMRRLRAEISRHDSVKRFQEMGVDIFLGEGRFASPEAVEVEGKTLHFKKAVIATGSRPVHPPIEGLAEAGFLTNETVFSLTRRPERLAIIGGGPIGCELAQAFRRLGSEVILFHNAPQILSREDGDAAEIIRKAFIREGIRLVLDCKTKRVEKGREEKRIHYECGGREEIVPVDEILAGAGRAPVVEDLDLEKAGVRYDTRKGVVVNDYLQTTNSSVYAAGDICLKYRFTHTADASARIVVENALFWNRKKWTGLTIPWCTYTDPEIAHVGMYEKEAREKGIDVETFVRPLTEVDRAVLDGEEEGFVKLHVRKGKGTILGATIVARHAGEMIGEITLAMVGKIGLKTLGQAIHAYPTQVEAIRQNADAFNRRRLTPFVRRLFRFWFS
jgi:pyruvate/2-oxoglutarate dehydrogenase complex dihydrolipoamide dehydrogenase (E3) component